MMNKFVLCLALSFTLVICMSAQTITASKLSKLAKGEWLTQIIGADETHIYTLECDDNKDEYQVCKYDLTMNLVIKAKITIPKKTLNKDSYASYNGIIFSDNSLHFLYGYCDSKIGTCKFYKSTIDKTTLAINKDEVLLFTTDIVPEKLSASNRIKYRYKDYWRFSPDRKYISFFAQQVAKKTEDNIYTITTCDKTMTKLWTRTYTIPRARDENNIKDLATDNQGNAYILFDTNKQRGYKGNMSPFYKVFKASKDKPDLEVVDVNLGDKQVMASSMAIQADNEIEFAGFYTKDISEDEMSHGVFSIIVDFSKKSIKNKAFKEFTEDFILTGLSEKKQIALKKKSNKGKDLRLEGCVVRTLIKKNDGGFYLLGEQGNSISFSSTNLSGTISSTSTTRFVLNISVISINSKGEIEWMKQIPKEEIYTPNTSEVFFTSFIPFLNEKDDLSIIFSDFEGNFEGKRWKDKNDKGNTGGTIVKYNTKGEFQENTLYKHDKYEHGLAAYFSRQINPRMVILVLKGGGEQRYLKVDF